MISEATAVATFSQLLARYVQYGCWTNYCNTRLKNTPKLRQNCTQKTRHPRRPKLAAARSAAANFVRRLCRVFFACNFGVISAYFSTECCNNLSNNRSSEWSLEPKNAHLNYASSTHPLNPRFFFQKSKFRQIRMPVLDRRPAPRAHPNLANFCKQMRIIKKRGSQG